jgi:hypothetical protein
VRTTTRASASNRTYRRYCAPSIPSKALEPVWSPSPESVAHVRIRSFAIALRARLTTVWCRAEHVDNSEVGPTLRPKGPWEEWEAGENSRPDLSPPARALLCACDWLRARDDGGSGPEKVARSSVRRLPASSAFSPPESLTSCFLLVVSGNLGRLRERGWSMSMHTPTGFSWPEAVEPLEARRRARVVASFAEYLAE